MTASRFYLPSRAVENSCTVALATMEIDATCRYVIERKIKSKRFRVNVNSLSRLSSFFLFFFVSPSLADLIWSSMAESYFAHLFNKCARSPCQTQVFVDHNATRLMITLVLWSTSVFRVQFPSFFPLSRQCVFFHSYSRRWENRTYNFVLLG